MQPKPFSSHPETFRKTLDGLYETYNRRDLVTPDPLQFLYAYDAPKDREIVGFIAAALAYGRVAQIIRSIEGIVKIMGSSPYEFVMETDGRHFQTLFKGFCHRFAKTDQLSALFCGIKQVLTRFGSLEKCVVKGLSPDHDTLHPAMDFFVAQLLNGNHDPGHLLSLPWKKSACKRLNLFLRWMVRKDAVDPGGWDTISPEKLIIPLDTHIHQISLALGLTERSQANFVTALEITKNFRKIHPQDPVRYDFVLSRFGIRTDMNRVDLIGEF